MSLRATRRSLIAALTVGASLAIASSASAIPVPIGSSSDPAYSGSGTPTSVYSLLNGSYDALNQADSALVTLGDTAVPQTMPPETGTGELTTTQAQQIAADFTDTTINGTAPSASAWAIELQAVDTSYSTQAPEVGAAGTSWAELSDLVGFLGSASGIMQSADSASVSSSGTVVSTSDPFEYDVKLSAPSGGYIVPSAFSLTFPAGLSVNTALVSDEVNAAANGTSTSDVAAIEANPSGTSIGTVTLTSPLADEFGGANNQFVGKIYAVTTGASSGQGSATQPYLELWFTSGIYDMGSFPSSLAFPLTLNFGEATVAGLGQEPLPINSLELNFPAATSPVKTSSCTTLGTAGGTVTDEIAGLAYEFGDTTDGVSSTSGTPAAVTLPATATAVTNQCTATVTTVKSTLSGSASRLTVGNPTFTLKAKTGTAFGTVKVSLPSGLKFVKTTAKKLAKEVTASGAKIKSVKISGGKLVITLKSKVKSVTIKGKKGLVSETKALIKKIKKHKTKKLTFKVNAGNTALSTRVNA